MNKHTYFSQLGDRIKKIREDSGLKQKQFALRIGISVRALANYEANKREPEISVFRKILLFAWEEKIFCETNWLLFGPILASSLAEGKTFVEVETMERTFYDAQEILKKAQEIIERFKIYTKEGESHPMKIGQGRGT